MRYLISLLLVSLSFDLLADEPLTMEQAASRLQASSPELPVSSIRESTLQGYYEVVLRGGMTLYMDDRAEHFFAGDLFLVQEQGLVNATEVARVEARRDLLNSLDPADMIVFSPPKGPTRATVTVFTDIDCGYCRKLHQEVPELNRLGIEVRYLAYPRAGVGSASYEKAVSAWCADNPNLALTRAKAGKDIESRTCDNPVAAQYGLGGDFGVTGTPAVIYENGTLQAGYLPADQMAARLGIN